MIIVAQSTYASVEVGLHNGSKIIQSAALDKKNACAQLIPTLNALLQKEGATLKDVTQIIVNKGPAPFSSLRTVIATSNGLSFATGIPLIGVSAFEALSETYNPDGTQELLILLRAYSKEYYYGFYAPKKEPIVGSAHIDQLPPVAISANSIIVTQLDAIMCDIAVTTSKILIDYCTLDSVAAAGLLLIHNNSVVQHHISPLYIKNHF